MGKAIYESEAAKASSDTTADENVVDAEVVDEDGDQK